MTIMLNKVGEENRSVMEKNKQPNKKWKKPILQISKHFIHTSGLKRVFIKNVTFSRVEGQPENSVKGPRLVSQLFQNQSYLIKSTLLKINQIQDVGTL